MNADGPPGPANPDELAGLSLAQAGRVLAEGRVSAAELLEAVLPRVERTNPRLRAFLRVDAAAARRQARALDAEQAANGARGPLHGIPMAHKDMFHRAGTPSSYGSGIPQPVPQATANVLERLDAAGAVSFGVLNMAEFALGPTGHNWTYGHCRNPWNPDYITGGSSSGPAAAVAARMAFAALGSDTGASIRLPAACCGVTGLKPTTGRVSRAGALVLSASLDTIGPLARSAHDCALLMNAIAGHDAGDPTTASTEPPDYLAGIDRPIAGLRVGVPVGWFDEDLDPDVARVMQASRDTLRRLGCRLVPVQCPDMEAIDAAGALVMASEGAAQHANLLREQGPRYARQVVRRLERGIAIPATAYIDALRWRSVALARFSRAVFDSADVLHTPIMAMRTPRIQDTDLQDGEVLDRLLSRLTRLLRPFNYLGLPALSLPAGRDTNGLPIGMQLVARPMGEALLLRLGHAWQSATDWHVARPAC